MASFSTLLHPSSDSNGRTATSLAPSLASRAASVRGHAFCHHSLILPSKAIMRLHPSLTA
eukprot:2335950-Pleurochrysis_carterae.AAC.1